MVSRGSLAASSRRVTVFAKRRSLKRTSSLITSPIFRTSPLNSRASARSSSRSCPVNRTRLFADASLGKVGPTPSVDDVMDRALGYPKIVGHGLLHHSCRTQSADSSDCLRGELRLPVLLPMCGTPAEDLKRMADVFGSCGPLDVPTSVVQLVTVDVVYLVLYRRRVAAKCQRNKAVDVLGAFHSPIEDEAHALVSVVYRGRQNALRARVSNSPHAGHLVGVSPDTAPCFAHRVTAIM